MIPAQMSPVLLKFSLLAPGSALWELWGNLPASLWTLGQLWEPVNAHMWCLGPVRSTRLYCPLVESDMLVGTLLPTDHPHLIQHSRGMNGLQRGLLPCSTWEGGHLVTSRMPAPGTLTRCRWARLSCRTCCLHLTLSNQETATSEQQNSCRTPNTLTIPSSTFTPASLQICLNLRDQRFTEVEDSLKLTLRTRSCLIIHPEFVWPVKCFRLLDRLMWTSEITHIGTAGFFTFIHKAHGGHSFLSFEQAGDGPSFQSSVPWLMCLMSRFHRAVGVSVPWGQTQLSLNTTGRN